MLAIATPLLSCSVMSTPERLTSPLSSLSMSSITLPLMDPSCCLLGPALGDDVSLAGGANGVGAVSDGLSLGLVDGFFESAGETGFEIGCCGFVG